MRILVTGVTGQLGGALYTRLSSLGTVLPVDKTKLDLAKLRSIPDKLDRLAPDLIINPAAYTAVDKAEDEPELALQVNGEAPGFMARWAAERAVPFIHFSTDYVFDGHGERPWREEDDAYPISVYGKSKLAGENEVRLSGGCFLIVRTSWVYAARGKNFLLTVARLAREQSELRIVADQFGAPTSAGMIADQIAKMVEGRLDQLRDRFLEANGLVHFAASGETSWHGFACAIVDGLKLRKVPLAVENIVAIRADEYPTRARRPLNSRLDTRRFKTVFGIKPTDWLCALGPALDQLAAEHG